MVLIYAPVGKHQDIRPVLVRFIHLHKKPVDGAFQRCALIICNRHDRHLKAVFFHLLNLQHVCVGEDRVIDFQHLAVFRLFLQNISVLPHIDRRTCDNLLPDGINRRISNLCEKLLKIVKQRPLFF